MPFSYGFEKLSYMLPNQTSTIEELVKKAGYDSMMVEKIKNGGLKKVPTNTGSTLSNLINQSIKKVIKDYPDVSSRIGGIIFAHSSPFLCSNQDSFYQLCLKGLYLENIHRVGISGQPCAILHSGVKLAGIWLNWLPQEKGILLIGADQAYTPSERIYFGSVMGDSSFVGFLTKKCCRNRIIGTYIQSEIVAYEGEKSSQENIEKFRSNNPMWIRFAIESCLQQSNMSVNDLSYIVPHTPYTMIWDLIAELLRFPRERILTDYISQTGHLNSNDSFIHYTRAIKEKKIKDGEVVLLINPGFGGTRGCTLLIH